MDEFYVLNFLFINVITSVADMQLMFFDVYKNQKILSNYQMHRTFYLSSKEECAILCLNTLTCWSASYRRSTGECGSSSRSARSEPNTTQYDPEWIILNRNGKGSFFKYIWSMPVTKVIKRYTLDVFHKYK